jgi:hypothetical protein
MKAESARARTLGHDVNDPDEFIDTLQPDSPRAQP